MYGMYDICEYYIWYVLYICIVYNYAYVIYGMYVCYDSMYDIWVRYICIKSQMSSMSLWPSRLVAKCELFAPKELISKLKMISTKKYAFLLNWTNNTFNQTYWILNKSDP